MQTKVNKLFYYGGLHLDKLNLSMLSFFLNKISRNSSCELCIETFVLLI